MGCRTATGARVAQEPKPRPKSVAKEPKPVCRRGTQTSHVGADVSVEVSGRLSNQELRDQIHEIWSISR